MILIRFTGGLGNQLFQYALGYHLAIKNKTVLTYDDSILSDRLNPHELVTHRTFDVSDVFSIELNKASPTEIIYFNGKTNPNNLLDRVWNGFLWRTRKSNLVVEQSRSFSPDILELKDNKCIVGSWQSEKYFSSISDELRSRLNFKTPVLEISKALIERIVNTNSVCVHVRRGDYVTSSLYSKTIGALPVEYYTKAYELITAKLNEPFLFVFSDDIDWCKKNLQLSENCFFVEDIHAGIKAANYMNLMSHCKHFIISNSTFAWWSAWLGETKETLVIAPEKWFRSDELENNDLIPDRWIRI